MNPYVTGGYGSAAGILGLYALYVRHRARVLARALPPEAGDDQATPAPAVAPAAAPVERGGGR